MIPLEQLVATFSDKRAVAEREAALACLALSMIAAESVSLRLPPGDPRPEVREREVVFKFANQGQADDFIQTVRRVLGSK